MNDLKKKRQILTFEKLEPRTLLTNDHRNSLQLIFCRLIRKLVVSALHFHMSCVQNFIKQLVAEAVG